MTKRHEWQTVNRERHEPSDLHLNDILEEISAAIRDKYEKDETVVTALATAIDTKGYYRASCIIANALREMK